MSTETERVTVEAAAILLGMSQQGVREHMKRKLIDIGIATNPSGRKWQYYIYKEKLCEHMGIERKELELRLTV